jgi:hypothetical protein
MLNLKREVGINASVRGCIRADPRIYKRRVWGEMEWEVTK